MTEPFNTFIERINTDFWYEPCVKGDNYATMNATRNLPR